jgi:uncharacterized protein (DUF2267 family)
MKLTRRQLAAALSVTAIAPTQAQPQTASPADDLQTARDRLKANAAALAGHDLPMSVEPAFRFKA